eukprot:gnl/TRDRNA2_/TRDRNA2_175113_c2_seq6.p1 gnl/TRDRNA2_/TRDRNA2_175113_c2~~gnl/TRDRNA2_/TRDRNA2_175113_c2_seq6.p1  ORF type:complete len:349 (+),score=25.16 gnl/TRDRNA2_/TRDRNA2_175113_c2_seq6:74-1120(+)
MPRKFLPVLLQISANALRLQSEHATSVSCVTSCRERGVDCRGILRVRGGDKHGIGFGALFFCYTIQQIEFAETNCFVPHIQYDEELSNTYWTDGTNPWEYYFQPVQSPAKLTGLQRCEMSNSDIFEQNQVELTQQHYQYRAGHWNKVIERYYKLKQPVAQQVEREWQSLFPAQKAPVMGMHMRGTDRKNEAGFRGPRRDSQPNLYLPLAQEFLERNPDGRLFLATDDAEFARIVKEEWPPDVRAAVRMRNITRGEAGIRIFGGEQWGRGMKDKRQEGLNALIDVYLLSRCDRLLFGTSEFVWASIWLGGEKFKSKITNVEDKDESLFAFQDSDSSLPARNPNSYCVFA